MKMIEDELQRQLHELGINTAAPPVDPHDSLIEQAIYPPPTAQIEVAIHPHKVVARRHQIGRIVVALEICFGIRVRYVPNAN